MLISVIGSHAGEDVPAIFARKQKEIANTGLSYWLIKSFKARTECVQELCRKAASENESVLCLFVEPSSKNGARPTTCNFVAEHISENNKDWAQMPGGIKITGKIDRYSTALVFDDIRPMNRPISFDLQGYAEFQTGLPIKLQLGASTICCEQTPITTNESRFRNVIAAGRLHMPYAVWVR